MKLKIKVKALEETQERGKDIKREEEENDPMNNRESVEWN